MREISPEKGDDRSEGSGNDAVAMVFQLLRRWRRLHTLIVTMPSSHKLKPPLHWGLSFWVLGLRFWVLGFGFWI